MQKRVLLFGIGDAMWDVCYPTSEMAFSKTQGYGELELYFRAEH